MVVRIAHDVTCPWCWIGLHQARRLQADLGVTVDWVGYELWPEELEWPEPGPPDPPPPANKPETPSRLRLAYAAEGMEPPTATRPRRMRVHDALQACESAKAQGVGGEFVDRLYEAYWLRGERVGDVEVLLALAEGLLPDPVRFRAEIEGRAYRDRIVPFDDVAYSLGVYNVPTFFIGDERYAEQPYAVLAKAIQDART